ncbi:MAG: TetR/AcrR family transcriptional regulator [Mycobacterium sp.]|nr:TetR/AcrR family transcriptional regulator [Mycobacterium sp.]
MAVRDALIQSTIALMRRFGVAGTGISAVLDDSGVSRRSVYLNFPGGKSELVHEATLVAGSHIASQIEVLTQLADLEAALTFFVDGWKQTLIDSDFTAGCPIVAAALGRAESAEAADAAGNAFGNWTQLLTAGLRSHGLTTSTAQTLATTIVAATEGAVLIALATRSTEPLDHVRASMSRLLAAHHADAQHRPFES